MVIRTSKHHQSNELCATCILWMLMVAVPATILVILLIRYYVEVPLLDQWWLLPLIVLKREGRLTLADVWLQNAEHRLFFPKIIMLALAEWTGWDLRYEVAANFLLTLLTVFVLGAYMRRVRRAFRGSSLAFPWAVVSTVLFSPAPFENWLWSWQVPYFLVQLCTVAAVVALSRWWGTAGAYVGAVVLAVIATFSFASGIATWLAGGAVIILSWSGRKQFYALLGWLGSCLLALAFYLFDYEFLKWTSPSDALKRQINFVLYLATYLGSGVGLGRPTGVVASFGIAFMAGLVYLALLLARISLRKRLALIPFFGLLIFSFGAAVLTALGRSNVQPLTQASSPRYIMFSQIGWMAGFVCFWGIAAEKRLSRSTRVFCKAVAGLLVIAFAFMWWFGLRGMAWYSKEMEVRREILISSRDYGELRRVYVVPEQLDREFRPLLRRYRLSLFRNLRE